jgi:hypothetical protein
VNPRPFFTVGLPTVNRSRTYLPRTIEALLGQSFTDFELLVSDNASTDDTAEVVRSFVDPRIRFLRRAERLAPAAHFAAIVREARGRFFVLNQDDDLLHCDFLRRAHDACGAHPEAVMYAAPIWRETPNRGYVSRALRPAEGYSDENVLRDRVYLVSGTHAAAKLFDPMLQFVHPTIAIDAARLAQVGGYESAAGLSADLITQARVLMHGPLAYDPRPGGIFRIHPENVSRTMKRSERKAYYRRTYAGLMAAFDESGKDWRAALGAYLRDLQSAEIMECVHEWLYYRAPVALQKFGMECLAQTWRGDRVSLWRKCASRIGVRNLLRYGASRVGW